MNRTLQTITPLIISILMFSCSTGQNRPADGYMAENVNVEQFSSHLTDAQILDVRTPQEWDGGIIEGAVLYNFYDADFASNLEKLNKEKKVAVYCKVGGRSGKAMQQMSKSGFKEVYNLSGAWMPGKRPANRP